LEINNGIAVIDIIDKCCGAIILGYPQLEFHHHVKQGPTIKTLTGYLLPTPWNHIEGALAYRAKAPVLVIAHTGVNGGIFDHGVTGEYILTTDLSIENWHQQDPVKQLFEEWRKRIEQT